MSNQRCYIKYASSIILHSRYSHQNEVSCKIATGQTRTVQNTHTKLLLVKILSIKPITSTRQVPTSNTILFFHLVVRSHGVVAAIRAFLRVDVFLRRPRQLGVHVRLAVGVPLVSRRAGRSGPAASRTGPCRTTALIPVVTARALDRTALTPTKSSTKATLATSGGGGGGRGYRLITDAIEVNTRNATPFCVFFSLFFVVTALCFRLGRKQRPSTSIWTNQRMHQRQTNQSTTYEDPRGCLQQTTTRCTCFKASHLGV